MYIRFGDIPENEKSGIYRGEEKIGEENGVSVYTATKDNSGNWCVSVSLPITKSSLDTFTHLMRYDNRPCYLVEGDYVGKDTDNQPLIKNIKIIETLKYR